MYICNTRCNVFQNTEHNMSDNFKQWIISVLFWKRNATHGLKPAALRNFEGRFIPENLCFAF